MNNIIEILFVGLLIGGIFGFALEKARVFEPGMIIGQLQLRNFIMLKVFLTAVATGLVIFSVFQFLGFERLNWKIAVYKADIVGGLVLGIGVALAGACPGTLFAQLGAGYKDALGTLVGAFLGAITFFKLQAYLQVNLLTGYPNEKLTLDMLVGLPHWVVASIIFFLILMILFLLESYRKWTDDLGKNYDGLK
ncbi:MAG: hypothetical protein FJX71_06610 [Alphaproteobacteria bacterium]|nr:hypothetical protein [Alphaproteobacteria bacterium]